MRGSCGGNSPARSASPRGTAASGGVTDPRDSWYEPGQLSELASTLERLSENDVEDLLASRDPAGETEWLPEPVR